MKLKLKPRKHIEKDIGEEAPIMIKFFDKTGKQLKAQKKLIKSKDTTMLEFEELLEEHFWENIEAQKDVIVAIKKHFDENGGLQEFMKELETDLGKQKAID